MYAWLVHYKIKLSRKQLQARINCILLVKFTWNDFFLILSVGQLTLKLSHIMCYNTLFVLYLKLPFRRKERSQGQDWSALLHEVG